MLDKGLKNLLEPFVLDKRTPLGKILKNTPQHISFSTTAAIKNTGRRMIMKEKAIFFLAAVSLFVLLPSLGQALCVKVPMANLRVGPGTGYAAGWQVNKYMPFVKVGVSLSGHWYAVKDVDGDVLWINKNLVSTQYRCAAVTAKIANIRTGPGIHYKKSSLSPAHQYDSFKIERKDKSWIKVRAEDNRTGWIRRDFLWVP